MKFSFLIGFISSLGLHASILYAGYAIFLPANNKIEFVDQQNKTQEVGQLYIFDISLDENLFPADPGASRDAVVSESQPHKKLLTSAGKEQSGNGGALQSFTVDSGSPIEASAIGIAPYYPRLSREKGEQGRPVYKVLLDESRVIKKIELLESSGFERLDQAGAEALNNAQVPFLFHGTGDIAVSYRLK